MLNFLAWIVAIAGLIVAALLLGVSVWVLVSGYEIGQEARSEQSQAAMSRDAVISSLTPELREKLEREARERNTTLENLVVQILQSYLRVLKVQETEVRFVGQEHWPREQAHWKKPQKSEKSIHREFQFWRVPDEKRGSSAQIGISDYDVEEAALEELSQRNRRD